MAQRVYGIDLGAHTVKVAELELGFRSFELVGLRSFSVPAGPQPALERSLTALSANLGCEAHDLVAVAFPGDRTLFRLLDVPLTDPKRLPPIVGNELADDAPWELDELVFDFTPLVAQRRVLVAAARSEEVGALLRELGANGTQARQLPPAPLAYGGIGRRVCPEGTVLLLDVGHQRTNACLLIDGRPLYGRTIHRGGFQLTERLRQLFQLSFVEAERFKHTHGLVVNDSSGLDAASRRIANACAEAITPLVREIKRTIVICEGHLGAAPERVLLCGGSAQLTGISDYLALELERPVARIAFGEDEELAHAELSHETSLTAALALSLALEAGRRPTIDLRQGKFAFKADSSLLREKIVTLSVALCSIVVLAFGSAWAGLHALGSQGQKLEKELARATRGVFGKAETDPWRASKRIKGSGRTAGVSIPERTAVHLLSEISKRVPAKDQVKLDIDRLDIKPGKTYLRGTADSRAAIGQVVKALKGYSCFKEVHSGRVSEVAGGKKQFSLTIASKCF